jgi:hypothetical protein
VQEKHLHPWVIANPFRPDPKDPFRGFDRDQSHTTTEYIVATRVVQVLGVSGDIISVHVDLLSGEAPDPVNNVSSCLPASRQRAMHTLSAVCYRSHFSSQANASSCIPALNWCGTS